MHPTWNILGLADWIEQLKVMREQSFETMRLLSVAWLIAPSPQLITTALVYSGLSRQHHAKFYRLFSQACWSVDDMAEALARALVDAFVPKGELHVIFDDTLCHHPGYSIAATGCHIDPVRSSKSYKVKAYGHVWLIAALRLQFPFSPRPFTLPIAFRLYRTQADCEATGEVFRKKTELAEELMVQLAGWFPRRRIRLCVDNAYFCTQLLQNRPHNVDIIGRLKANTVLRTATPPTTQGTGQAGRPRKQGHLLPTLPEIYADDQKYPWHQGSVDGYRHPREVSYKSFSAQWYPSNGPSLMRVVIVKMTNGTEPFRVYASTRRHDRGRDVLCDYAGRWSIEVTNRDLKQDLGFGASGVRNARSVARLAPFVGCLFSIVVAWYAQHGVGSEHDWLPLRPWDTDKTAPAFCDMLAAAQHAIRAEGIFPEYGQHDFPRNCRPPWHALENPTQRNPDQHEQRQSSQGEKVAA